MSARAGGPRSTIGSSWRTATSCCRPTISNACWRYGATTKLVRAAGLRIRLVDAPFEQPLGYRSAPEVWARQLRWARLRQASFRRYYAVEILAGGVAPLVAAAGVLAALEWPVGSVIALAAMWYGAEA